MGVERPGGGEERPGGGEDTKYDVKRRCDATG